MKTTFSRQFALIASLLLVCMIFTGVSFRFLMLGYLKTTKRDAQRRRGRRCLAGRGV